MCYLVGEYSLQRGEMKTGSAQRKHIMWLHPGGGGGVSACKETDLYKCVLIPSHLLFISADEVFSLAPAPGPRYRPELQHGRRRGVFFFCTLAVISLHYSPAPSPAQHSLNARASFASPSRLLWASSDAAEEISFLNEVQRDSH